MREIELKFQVPPARRVAIDAAVAGRTASPRVRLQATYFDTTQRSLAKSGLALRIRREGRRWVQTLKGEGDDSLTRAEHNVPLAAGREQPGVADPRLHAGTPVGERLLALLAERGESLVPVHGTDIRRRKRVMRTRGGSVELAFDEGRIVAGERALRVCELEIELVSGSALAVIATARSLALRHGLWLDARSKAERGDMLARGESMSPWCKAAAIELSASTSVSEAARTVLRSCLAQILRNGSQVACGSYDAEHVHQLRIGLRRLRTALRLFDDAMAGHAPWAALAEPAAALFRGLGAARDLVAIAEPMERELAEALRAAGLSFTAPTLPAPADADEPAVLIRSRPAQALLLDLLALTQADFTQPPPGADEPALRDFIAKRLSRWHRRAVDDAARWSELDDEARHRLRKRIKRLRYAIEFAQALFDARRVRRYLKPLRALQERLGALVDVTVALDAYRRSSDTDPHALFAVGWLTARKQKLLRETADEAAAFTEIKRFWKKK